MSKKKNLPLFENIVITSLSSDGRSIAKINNIVTFIPLGVPGDVVNVQITKKKSSYMEGVITAIVQPSKDRINARCPHFGLCGGCKWQMMQYERQTEFKQQHVKDCMLRIGKIEIPPIEPIISAGETFAYRNKLEFAFASKRWLTADQMSANVPFSPGLGFHMSGSFDKVLHIDNCLLMEETQNAIRNAVYLFACDNEMSFYNEREHSGMLRNLIIRNNHKNDWMVVVVFGHEALKEESGDILCEKAVELLRFIENHFPAIKSLQYCINDKYNDTLSDLKVMLWNGNDSIEEQIEDLSFRVGPKSFYQTNTCQVIALYKKIKEYVLSISYIEKPIIYDLYTGTGTIALFLADIAKRVIGIEYVEEAVSDAWKNATLNNIDNVSFYSGDMKNVLTDEFVATCGRPDVIILDPPRVGLHPDVVRTLLHISCKSIIYVSCNPATQARDINLLSEQYRVKKMCAVDMFPHTQHIENIAFLQRTDGGEFI